jgi:alpha-tubulin suppressor-like RCC1 family protein
LGTGRTATAVGTGLDDVCARLDDGSVKCWGSNGGGQLGLGDTANRGDGPGEMGDDLPPVSLGSGVTVSGLAVGGLHACTVVNLATVKCWGASGAGQLGLGDTSTRGDGPGEMGDSLPRVVVDAGFAASPATDTVVRMTPGTYQFRVTAWNAAGAGVPSAASNSVTVTGGEALPGAPTAVTATPGDARARVTWTTPGSTGGQPITDYRVTVYSQSGGTPAGVNGATTRSVGSNATSFAFTGLSNGTPYTFRVAAVTSVGTGPLSTPSAPVVPRFGSSPVTGGTHSCALNADQRLRCWGHDNYGQLGNDTTRAGKPTPVPVSGLGAVDKVSTGRDHTCALLESGGPVKCWGRDAQGQLGDNAALADKPTPVSVAGLQSAAVMQISAGGDHTCALLTTGSVKCWGSDDSGQLGDNPQFANKAIPVSVTGISTAKSIAAGGHHTCALLVGGAVKCWGADTQGQLGDNAAIGSKATPVAVSGVANATAISAGANHTCALLAGGALKCWGFDGSGQLGDGSAKANKPTPVGVFGLASGVSKVAAGGNHTCAVLSTGSVRCWGADGSGQLGDNNLSANKATPVAVAGVGNADRVAAGGRHTCVGIASTGALRCWGNDAFGQLGDDATFASKPTPVAVKPLG